MTGIYCIMKNEKKDRYGKDWKIRFVKSKKLHSYLETKTKEFLRETNLEKNWFNRFNLFTKLWSPKCYYHNFPAFPCIVNFWDWHEIFPSEWVTGWLRVAARILGILLLPSCYFFIVFTFLLVWQCMMLYKYIHLHKSHKYGYAFLLSTWNNCFSNQIYAFCN